MQAVGVQILGQGLIVIGVNDGRLSLFNFEGQQIYKMNSHMVKPYPSSEVQKAIDGV